MNKKTDFSDLGNLIDDFPTTRIRLPSKHGSDSGSYDDSGEWVPKPQSDTFVQEPLAPNSKQAKFNYQPGGQVVLYDATWYSHHNELQVGDQIKDMDSDVLYQIADKTDYSRFANAIEYGLKAVIK